MPYTTRRKREGGGREPRRRHPVRAPTYKISLPARGRWGEARARAAKGRRGRRETGGTHHGHRAQKYEPHDAVIVSGCHNDRWPQKISGAAGLCARGPSRAISEDTRVELTLAGAWEHGIHTHWHSWQCGIHRFAASEPSVNVRVCLSVKAAASPLEKSDITRSTHTQLPTSTVALTRTLMSTVGEDRTFLISAVTHRQATPTGHTPHLQESRLLLCRHHGQPSPPPPTGAAELRYGREQQPTLPPDRLFSPAVLR